MPLTGSEFKELQDALLDAFDYSGLKQMVLTELGADLEEVALGGSLKDITFELITWTERSGRTQALVAGAMAANGDNPRLRQFAAHYTATVTADKVDTPIVAAPPAGTSGQPATRSGPEQWALLFLAILLLAALVAAGSLYVASMDAGRQTAWLVIERLDAFGAFAGRQMRVTAHVNGVDYLYPSLSGVEWLEVGPTMSSQSFRLPTTADTYVIRFSAEVRPLAGDDAAPSQLVSVHEDVIAVPADLPYKGIYALHLLGDQSRVARVAAEVVYSVTYDP